MALAVVGVVLAVLTTVLKQGEQTYGRGVARLVAQQDARVALERLARELRGAGYDPRGIGFPPLLNPTSTSFTIQNDMNGDGVIAGNRESITYLLRGSTLRRNAGGGAQPLIEEVNALALTYLDEAGERARTPAEIRTVIVTITTGRGFGGVNMTTQVRLRNR